MHFYGVEGPPASSVSYCVPASCTSPHQLEQLLRAMLNISQGATLAVVACYLIKSLPCPCIHVEPIGSPHRTKSHNNPQHQIICKKHNNMELSMVDKTIQFSTLIPLFLKLSSIQHDPS